MSDELSRTAQHWDETRGRFSGRNVGLSWWEAGPEIQRHINCKISGIAEISWIAYTLDKYFSEKPASQCLVLGCGSGSLERSLARLNGFQHCDAYDIAEGSIQEARKLAQTEGLNITYYVADVNKLVLAPDSYDAVWITAAMHHFEALEHVCEQIRRALKPGGLLILNEYIGPNRFQFPAGQKEVTNLCLQLLPIRYRIVVPESIALELERASFRKGTNWFIARVIDKIRDRDLIGAIRRRFVIYKAQAKGQRPVKTTVDFPTAHSVIAIDPSEAIRSEEIMEILQQYFEIVEKKDWGGNILQYLLAGIAGNFSDGDKHSQALLKMLINVEDTLLNCGEFESDFAYIVARPLGT